MWLARAAEVRSSNPLFDRVMLRALLDLRLLRASLHGRHFFCAGVPCSPRSSAATRPRSPSRPLPYGSAMAGQTLRLLARYQAQAMDAYRDAEPGKILHELRTGELARLGADSPVARVLRLVDATPLFLILLAEYVAWSGDLALARALRPNVDGALGWIERFGDHDGDGYLDYVGRYRTGSSTRAGRTPATRSSDADGALPEPPIAVCEVQAYCYRAWRQTAALLRTLGDGAAPTTSSGARRRCAKRFERDFWSEELGCYVLARQAGGRPVVQVASNAGQVLWGGIAARARAARVATRLLADDMFSGWGIPRCRTRASPTTRSAITSAACGRTTTVSSRPGSAATIRRPPRCACSTRSTGGDGVPPLPAARAVRRLRAQRVRDRPVSYPVACSPQAWAAGAIPHAVEPAGTARGGARASARRGAPRLPSDSTGSRSTACASAARAPTCASSAGATGARR